MRVVPRAVYVSLMFAIGAAATGSCTEHTFNGYRVESPMTKSTVAWQRTDGTPFNIAQETEGRVTLLYFGYTHCPDVCPMQLMNLATAMRTLGPDTASRLRVIVISLDPARDTGAVFDSWLNGFHPQFIGLTGTLAQVDSEVARLKLAPRTTEAPGQLEADPAHASAMVAYAKDGLAHFIYPANVSHEAWAYDLRKLLRDSVP